RARARPPPASPRLAAARAGRPGQRRRDPGRALAGAHRAPPGRGAAAYRSAGDGAPGRPARIRRWRRQRDPHRPRPGCRRAASALARGLCRDARGNGGGLGCARGACGAAVLRRPERCPAGPRRRRSRLMDDGLVLRDIHLSTAPPWWPPAPGWWGVAAVVLAVLAALAGWRLLRARRRRRLLALF